MSLNQQRIDHLIQYALLTAGEEDQYMDRQLGPIHLIKYVYLADLLHAKRFAGEIYTGISWQFYKFGPWSQHINQSIEPALIMINAEKKSFTSDYKDEDEWIRWTCRDAHKLRDLEQTLPGCITMQIPRLVHEFGKDTPSLLGYVYNTNPMLAAKPNDTLNFESVVEDKQITKKGETTLRMDSLSKSKKKKFSESMSVLREQYRATNKSKKKKLVNPVKSPRYDQVYEDGINWLDDLAGQQFESNTLQVEFDDEVWESPTRRGEDVS